MVRMGFDMALTMTRTRTQTALTKLAEMVANVHGELEFVDELLAVRNRHEGGQSRSLDEWAALEARMLKLCADRDALYVTIRQFDWEIDPGQIGSAKEWMKEFGRMSESSNAFVRRYLRRPWLQNAKGDRSRPYK